MDKDKLVECAANYEELAIAHGQQVTVTFKDSADAFALFNELQARAVALRSHAPK